VRLTKTELREQTRRIDQLSAYLPMLQLKKSLLQHMIEVSRLEHQETCAQYKEAERRYQDLLHLRTQAIGISLEEVRSMVQVECVTERVVGMELPLFGSSHIGRLDYSLFSTPPWTDEVVIIVQKEEFFRRKQEILDKRMRLLQEELRSISVRVNLFEKVLIPRAQMNVRKIRLFLSDQQLNALAQVKVAKKKIEERESEKGKKSKDKDLLESLSEETSRGDEGDGQKVGQEVVKE